MELHVDELLEQALTLCGADRLQLAEALFAGVVPVDDTPPFDPEWLSEAKRRADCIDSGTSKLSSWEEVRERGWSGRSSS